MWKDYSWSYIKNNRASSLSVTVAAFISALLLSLLCSLFYNFWHYDIEGFKLKEGAWQARITGEMDAKDMALIQNFANVDQALVNEELSVKEATVVDIYFKNMRTIFDDMPQIAENVGLEPDAITYHYTLLNMYLIRDPDDPAPRMIFPLNLGITIMACFSLVMIIHNSFAVSMNARIHQFGIFSSVGATPRQIRTCLLQEAASLCAIPIAAGNLLGIALSMGVMELTNTIAKDVDGRHEAVWVYHPLVFVFTLAITIITVWISAWLPARKMSRLTPLEAIKNTGELQLKRKKSSPILNLLFGTKGELAGNALKAQKKALRTATLSLLFSFLAFTLMQCFFTLSKISQRMTYYEKYQDAWDIMVTLKDTQIESFEETDELQRLTGVQSGVVYQRAKAKRILTQEEISEDLTALNGMRNAPEKYVTDLGDEWLVSAPIVILDDASFQAYCEQIGVTPRLDGAVILNQIRDSTNSDFRNTEYFSYVKENQSTSVLRQSVQEEITAEIPVISYTREVPLLREEYATLDYYELVHFLPLSVWKEIKGQIGGEQEDSYIRILADENVTLEELTALQEEVGKIVDGKYEVESENRIQDKKSNDQMIQGMMLIIGGFCVLLAVIGIGNVFSNTLGFVRQRRREFARYMSVGLTPGDMKKMFCIEALVLAGRPVLITLPLTVTAVGLMIKASYLDPMIFIREAPVMPIFIFFLAVFGFVALAYGISWKRVARISLTDALRDDTMM